MASSSNQARSNSGNALWKVAAFSRNTSGAMSKQADALADSSSTAASSAEPPMVSAPSLSRLSEKRKADGRALTSS